MCRYLSFLIDGDLNIHYAGELNSHCIVRDFHQDLSNDLMEAEWTAYWPEYLIIRSENEKIAELTKKLLVDKYPTRNDFIEGEIKSFKTKNGFCYYRGGKLHREDGPAIEWPNGDKEWYLNDERHRTDGPAIEWSNGTKKWYLNGERHRTDGPAIEWSDGTKKWYLNGKLHRENGPAIERSNGTKEWFLNDERHRTDGPAIERSNGTKEWYLNGKLHRENGPAIEWSNGTKEWYLNGDFIRMMAQYKKGTKCYTK